MNTHWLSRKLLWQLFIFTGALILIITIVAGGVNISSASQGNPVYPAPDIKQKKFIESPMPTTHIKEMKIRRTAGAGIIIFGVIVRGSRSQSRSSRISRYVRRGRNCG
jgi:hypothetical protein